MTGKETIDYLLLIKMLFDNNYVHEALDIAIESLLVEAEDKHYTKIYADDEPSIKAEKLYQICGETQNKEVVEWLKEYFPSVDKQQGEWTKLHDMFNQIIFFAEYKCSNCGKINFIKSDFCPNCGADMRGTESEVGE